MTNTGSAPAGNRVGATGNLRPAPRDLIRVLPVPMLRALPAAAEWNELLAKVMAA
jgi:hypothetical protein